MNPAQLSAGIDAEILAEDPPQPTEGFQCLRLASVTIQRHHQLTPPPLTQRALGDQCLKLARQLVVAA